MRGLCWPMESWLSNAHFARGDPRSQYYCVGDVFMEQIKTNNTSDVCALHKNHYNLDAPIQDNNFSAGNKF